MTVALIAGLTSGAVLFVFQFFAIRPMIELAEVYEKQLIEAGKLPHEDPNEWQPSEGVERVGYTAISTLLLSVGYAAVLFGLANLLPLRVGTREGLMLGLAAFACFALAPAIGLPPKPPGVQGAELNAAQLWWASTAVATAIGLAVIFFARGRWTWWVVAALIIAAPHLIGAPPVAPAMTENLHHLSVMFALMSVATQFVFWLVLGTVGGYYYGRSGMRAPMRRAAVA
jgi:cobalt transporter subunit CbtA